jgi:peptidoglycan/LPS O-acetylase OafA/YrhL
MDLLRFLAALGVVFFHYGFRGYKVGVMPFEPYPTGVAVFKYGYLGVQLFFMISGFVILMSAAHGSLTDFVISRIVRLYPAFWACCTITFLATVTLGGSLYSASLSRYLVNMTMLSGFVGVSSVDGVYWSLFVELRFYVLVGLVLLIGKIHKAQSFILFWWGASVLLEFYPISKLRFLLITDYSAFFIAGAACYLVLSQGMTRTRLFIVLVSWGVALVKSIRELPGLETEYKTPLSSYVVAGIVSCFFLIMMLIASGKTGWFGRTRWLLAGVLTYPLYLLHQKIGYMIFTLGYPKVNSHVLFWGVVAVSVSSAYLVHRLIEKPSAPVLKARAHKVADRMRHLLGFLPAEANKARERVRIWSRPSQ